MSKKVKEPSTPESRAEKLAHKQMLRKAFTSTFFKAFAVCLSILLVYSIVYISLVNPSRLQMSAANGNNTAQNAVVPNNNTVSSDGSASSDGSSDAAATPTVTELTDTSSQADILAYFNTAINKVKPNAKQITLNSEVNSTAGGISGNLPGTLTSMADGLIADNMGPKDLSSLDPGLVNATTTDQKNAMFPVENESWSSKLTADDISSATYTEADGKYTITILVKEDAPSTDTAHGTGHNGKVFSVIMPSIVTDNAGPAASLIKDVKTGHKDGKIVVTVDKETGNVETATYYFVWTLSLKALGMEVSIPFGLEKNFTITW
ncbi:MAG TPA: hypothetical protein IAB30_06920 [Candidatus Fimenecus excrementavium]|nr:hypothetical protein [Candidatus Fimenecus excrementavium]